MTNNTYCYINVSIGELFDKYSILEIKSERIDDPLKLKHVLNELEILKNYILNHNIQLEETVFDELKNINEKLWIVEDNIRLKEDKKEFDSEFIELARSVYILNDKRSYIKNKINNLLNSNIIDIKSYKSYNL